MADRLILAQQYREAINQYFKGTSTYSGRTKDAGRQQMYVWDDIGYAYLELGVYKGEVIVHLDAFDERNEGAFYCAQGLCSQETGAFSEAEAKFRSAMNAHYDEVDVRQRLAELYIEQGRFEEAETQLDLAKALDVGHPEIAILMKCALDKTHLKTGYKSVSA